MTLILNDRITIELLDCTLRDGAHVNKGHFSKKLIEEHALGIDKGGIDICEIGFLECANERGPVYYSDRASILSTLKHLPNSKSSLMLRTDRLNGIDLDLVGTVDIIRIAMYEKHLEDVYSLIENLDLTHKKAVFLNPINISHCSERFIGQVIDLSNKYDCLAGVCIVDTFGALNVTKAVEWYKFFDKNLKPGKNIGLHFHENLGLSLGMVEAIIGHACCADSKRKLIIDASILGMGRQPGNLEIEKLILYLNNKHSGNYNILPVLKLIENYYSDLKKEYEWGYSPVYAISAALNLHRNYAEELVCAEGLDLSMAHQKMHDILEVCSDGTFDKKYLSHDVE